MALVSYSKVLKLVTLNFKTTDIKKCEEWTLKRK